MLVHVRAPSWSDRREEFGLGRAGVRNTGRTSASPEGLGVLPGPFFFATSASTTGYRVSATWAEFSERPALAVDRALPQRGASASDPSFAVDRTVRLRRRREGGSLVPGDPGESGTHGDRR